MGFYASTVTKIVLFVKFLKENTFYNYAQVVIQSNTRTKMNIGGNKFSMLQIYVFTYIYIFKDELVRISAFWFFSLHAAGKIFTFCWIVQVYHISPSVISYHVNNGHCKRRLHVDLKIVRWIHYFSQTWTYIWNMEFPGEGLDCLRRFGILGAKKQENTGSHLITNCNFSKLKQRSWRDSQNKTIW